MKPVRSVALLACLVSSALVQAQSRGDFMLGTPVPLAAATRTITIAPDTRWVNVTQGDSVRFVAGTAEFAWRFDGPGSRPFDLQLAAPAGALGRPLTVYVAPLPGHKP